MTQSLSGTSSISNRAVNGFFNNIKTKKIIINNQDINTLIDSKVACIKNVISKMFILSSNCQVIGLTDNFKDLICDAVNNYCPYYYCDNCNNSVVVQRGLNNLNNFNNFNSTDNSISFFHEEILNENGLNKDSLNDDSLSNDFSSYDFSTTNISQSTVIKNDGVAESKNTNNHLNFLATNLNNDEYLFNNNFKIFSLGKVNKGKWLFNGNISIEFPKSVSMKNLKIYIYLDENIVPAGEIILGSHMNSNELETKSYPFNLMFENNLSGRELKIGLISIDNTSNIKLLKTTNFFANLM